VIKLVRFFIESEQLRDGTVTITGNDAHHITRVLRLEAGDLLECVDPQGFVHLVRVESVGSQVTGRVEETRKGLQESPLHLVLFQGLAKGDKMDLVIQKAVELGAAEVVPFTSRYTVVKLGAKQEENKLRRWERIALEAAKQCGRTRLPKVEKVLSFGAVVAQVKEAAAAGHLVLAAYEAERERGISQIAAQPKTVWVVVGSEGGFTPEEIEQLQQAGAEICTLGPRILRTETAGLVLLSIVGHRWGDLG
jgi:16S rRNA (uracil1498-N3)-methyltransferase